MKVLDTSALLRMSGLEDDTYTVTNSVLNEIRDESAGLVVESAIRSKNLKILEPGKESRGRVIKAAKKTGDLLSDADIDVLALALEKKLEVITDDYGIQNVAKALKIRYSGLTQDGIKKKIKWVKVCPGCGRKYATDVRRCSACDTKLKKCKNGKKKGASR